MSPCDRWIRRSSTGFIKVIAEGLLFVASCFPEHKRMGSRFLSSCCFPGAQGLGEVQHSPCDTMSDPEWRREREKVGWKHPGMHAYYESFSKAIRGSSSQNWPAIVFTCLFQEWLCLSIPTTNQWLEGSRLCEVWPWCTSELDFKMKRLEPLIIYASCRRRSARCTFMAVELGSWLLFDRHRSASLAVLRLH